MLFPDTQHLNNFEKGICLANFRKLPSSSLSLFFSLSGRVNDWRGGGAFPWPPESGIHKEHEGLGLLIQDKPTLFTLILPDFQFTKEKRGTHHGRRTQTETCPQSQRRCHTLAHRYTNTFSEHTEEQTASLSFSLAHPLSSPSHPHTHTTTVYQLAPGRETEGRAEMNVKILTLVIVLVVSLLCSASAGKSGAWRLLPRASPCLSFSLCC